MSRYGDLNYEDRWYNSPLEKYIEHKEETKDLSEKRLNDICRIIKNSPNNSEYDSLDEFTTWEDNLTVDEMYSFLQQLRHSKLDERTVRAKMRTVSSFLGDLLERKIINSNPAAYVLDEVEFDIEPTNKMEKSVQQVSNYLRNIQDPEYRGLGFTFVKTGIRRGENNNIDLPHIHIDDEYFYSLLDQHGITLHEKIADKPDSLYIPSEPMVKREYRGEIRQLGNKRERDTVIPIDNELKDMLLDWLSVRPHTAYPHPLWTSPFGEPNRIGGESMRNLTTYWAEKTGFISDAAESDFSMHWFRHFFSTQLKPGFGDHPDYLETSMIKYLRGDVNTGSQVESTGRDVLDIYTHDWGDTIRQEYLDAIYKFRI